LNPKQAVRRHGRPDLDWSRASWAGAPVTIFGATNVPGISPEQKLVSIAEKCLPFIIRRRETRSFRAGRKAAMVSPRQQPSGAYPLRATRVCSKN